MLRFLAVVLIIAYIAPIYPVTAQDDDVSELINLINGLRASSGLEPYLVDYGLMALAQEHSEYQASIHTSTHLHSDGRNPPQIGVVENVAGGDIGYLTPEAAVYEVWADPVHGRTMVGYASGSIGVGIADDGTTVYYTLEVRPGGTPAPKTGAPDPGTAQVPLTPIPFATLVPATPLPDGSIIHIVGYGQTLWAIALAYGIRIEQIRAWNNIPADSNDIYVGQKLLVRPANRVTASPTPSTGPGTPQIEDDRTASTSIHATAASITPPPPGSTPTLRDHAELQAASPDPAGPLPTGTETQVAVQPSSNDAPANASLLPPLLAGGSILLGCMLLLFLRINKKPYG